MEDVSFECSGVDKRKQQDYTEVNYSTLWGSWDDLSQFDLLDAVTVVGENRSQDTKGLCKHLRV